MLVEPRDWIVEAGWWPELRTQLDANLVYLRSIDISGLADEEIAEIQGDICQQRYWVWQCEYSAGSPLADFTDHFCDIVRDWVSVMNASVVWAQSVELASIAQMLGCVELLAEFWPGGAVDFGPMKRNRLRQWLVDDPVAMSDSSYRDIEPSDGLAANMWTLIQIGLHTPDDAAAALHRFVNDEWYAGSKDRPWWGSHQGSDGRPHAYVGYWCWPAAAIARKCGIDDSGLRGQKYYPHDLAHLLDH